MLAQIFITALVSGTVVLMINLFRNRYLNKPLKWTVLRILAYFVVAISSMGLTAMNPNWFYSFDGWFCAVPLAAFTPAFVEWVCLLAAENLGIYSKLTKKTESS